MRRKRIAVDGYKVPTYTEGSGNHVLLVVHGGPGVPCSYVRDAHLRYAKQGFRVVSWDQLGCGESDRPDDPSLWQIPRFVEELETVRTTLGLGKIYLLGNSWGGMLATEYCLEGLLPLLPVTPDVDRPSTFQARFSDRAVRCARAFGLGEVGFDCCQAGWRTGIRLQLRRIGGRAVAGARPARIRRVVRRCRGSRRVGGARRCRAGCRRPLRCGGGGSSGTRTRRDSHARSQGKGRR